MSRSTKAKLASIITGTLAFIFIIALLGTIGVSIYTGFDFLSTLAVSILSPLIAISIMYTVIFTKATKERNTEEDVHE